VSLLWRSMALCALVLHACLTLFPWKTVSPFCSISIGRIPQRPLEAFCIWAIFLLSVIKAERRRPDFSIFSINFGGSRRERSPGAIINEDVSPGQEIAQYITVINGMNDSRQNMTAEVFGFATNEGGANVALSPEMDNGPYTARPFLSIEPKNFTLDPGEQKILRLTGTVPEDIGPGGRYASVLIVPEPMAVKGSDVNVVTAIQSLVLLTIKGSDLIKKGEITNLSASARDDGVIVDLIFKNTGNVDIKPQVTVNLFDSDGDILAAQGPEKDRVLPTNSRRFNFNLAPEAPLASGIYTVEATANLSDGTILDSERTTLEV
jgi:hypothetical protein